MWDVTSTQPNGASLAPSITVWPGKAVGAGDPSCPNHGYRSPAAKEQTLLGETTSVLENTHALGGNGHVFVHENITSSSDGPPHPSRGSILFCRCWCGPTAGDVEKMRLFPWHPPPLCWDGATSPAIPAGPGCHPTARQVRDHPRLLPILPRHRGAQPCEGLEGQPRSRAGTVDLPAQGGRGVMCWRGNQPRCFLTSVPSLATQPKV